MYCRNCGKEMDANQVACGNCGANQSTAGSTIQSATKSRLVVGLIGIFLGSLGIHNFILGYTNKGLTQLLLTVVGSIFTFGIAAVVVWVWALVESIQILTGNISHDAHGNPLTE